MTAVRVIDALLEILPLPDGTTIDDSIAEPARTAPGKLYAWPRRIAPQKLEEANGRWDEADLRVRILYTVAAKGEARVQHRDRDVSVLLDDLADEVHAAILANRKAPLWWDVYVDNVVFDAVRTFDVRGIGLDVVVRLNLPLPPESSGS